MQELPADAAANVYCLAELSTVLRQLGPLSLVTAVLDAGVAPPDPSPAGRVAASGWPSRLLKNVSAKPILGGSPKGEA